MSTRSSQVPQEGLGRRVEKMVQSALSELPIYNTVGSLDTLSTLLGIP